MPDAELPELATCSFTGYQRGMGTAVKIALYGPRFIKLPDPRYTSRQSWIYVSELAPRRHYFKTTGAEFNAHYLGQLEANASLIEQKLSWIPVENGRLVLLCFEKKVPPNGNERCHRRAFAKWWEERTGREVPELGGGR